MTTTTPNLTARQETCLVRFLSALIDQERARILVPPYRSEPGFWFGGGNLVQDEKGVVWMSGRYRNTGDSRTGLEAGPRGLECAIFRSDDRGRTFEKACRWSKEDVSAQGRTVLSIEGTSLYRRADGKWELFISSEKASPYPASLASYQKPGTGVWTIDRMTGDSPEALDASTLAPALEDEPVPEYLHVKDPVVFDDPGGDTAMVFCSHPFSWTSSNTGLAVRTRGREAFHVRTRELVSRGACWDVAATRVTGRLRVPPVGVFAGRPLCAAYFYDGAECLRRHEENPRGLARPRGFSCEEIGGAFFGWDDAFPELHRLSRTAPLFVSPWGAGTSRYVETLTMDDRILAIWQQAQPDGSQALAGHALPQEEAERLLSG